MREKVLVLLSADPNYDEYALKYFVLSMNKIQNYYEFSFSERVSFLLNDPSYDIDDVFNKFKENVKLQTEPDYIINIITAKLGPNLFFDVRENVSFITTDTWEKYFSPPSLFEYLLHAIFASLLYMNRSLDLVSHQDIRGCCLDYTYFKTNDRVDIVLGYLCDQCRDDITKKVSNEYYSQILYIISKEWIGNINEFGSVAYNLKHYFKFNIDKDSGFAKTRWEKVKDRFDEVPINAINTLISALIGALIASLFLTK